MRKRVRPRFWLIVIAFLLILFGVSGLAAANTLKKGSAALSSLYEQRAALSSEREELSETYAFSQTDEYVIRVARSELGMLMPNEIRYISSN